MDEETRNQVVKKLDELRAQVEERLGNDPSRHDPVAAHVDELRALVVEARPQAREQSQDAQAEQAGQLSSSANGLERRLLAWEADHPQLVALASRVVRALEDAGL